MNRKATTIKRHTDVAASAADQNAWAYTLDEVAHDDRHAGVSAGYIDKTSMRTGTPVITLNSEKIRYLMQVGVKLAAEAAQQAEMKSLFQNLVEENICGVCITGFLAATGSIKNSFFLFMEGVSTETIHRRARNEILNQSFNCWLCFGFFMKDLVGKFPNSPGIIVPVAGFVRQRVIGAVE